MARFRSSLRPIQSRKHVVDLAGSVPGAIVSTIDLVQGVDNPVLANVQDVEVGTIVNAIYLKVEAFTAVNATLRPNFYMIVGKNPGGNLVLPVPNAVGGNDNKKQIIHQEMIRRENSPIRRIR